jgi:predicted transcriptional regulator of viral defense system
MTAVEILVKLQRLRAPAVSTRDAASITGLSVSATTKALGRLSPLVRPLRRGLWSIGQSIDPLTLAPYLTAPYPSYISLQTALSAHGMISQIPSLIYVVTTDRAREIKTAIGTFSIHAVAPEFFLPDGFDVVGEPPNDVRMASPEKALLDIFYLSSTSDRRFAALPELELPKRFRVHLARKWIEQLPMRMKTIVSERFEAVVKRYALPARESRRA